MLSEGVGPANMDDLARYPITRSPSATTIRAARNGSGQEGRQRRGQHRLAARRGGQLGTGGRQGRPRDATGCRAARVLRLAWVRAITGRPVDEQCRCYREVSDTPSYLAGSPERVAGQRLIWRGELAAARST